MVLSFGGWIEWSLAFHVSGFEFYDLLHVLWCVLDIFKVNAVLMKKYLQKYSNALQYSKRSLSNFVLLFEPNLKDIQTNRKLIKTQ